MSDDLQKTIDDLRQELVEARKLADRYNADRQALVERVLRLKALLNLFLKVIEDLKSKEKDKEKSE